MAVVTRVVPVLAGLVLVALPGAARVDTPPTLEVAPTPAGGVADVTGSGWDPALDCTLTTDVPGATLSDGSCDVSTEGVLTEAVLIPAGTAPGGYLLAVCQPTCDQVNGIGAEVERTLEVQAPTPTIDDIDPVAPGDAATITGAGWDPAQACTLTTDVPDAAIEDGGCQVSGEGRIAEGLLIPIGTAPTTYEATVCQPSCDPAGRFPNASAPLVVELSPSPDGDGGSGEDDEATPGSGAWDAPVWWTVLAVLLLAALAAGTWFRRHRVVAPATAQAVLRSTQPPAVRVDGADRPPRWTIGLAPRSDPGTITIEEADR